MFSPTFPRSEQGSQVATPSPPGYPQFGLIVKNRGRKD
jgi:hypothetical protein